MSIDNRSLEAIREEAMRWVLRLQEEGFTEAEREVFFRWALSDPRRAREFRAHNAVVVMGRQLPLKPGDMSNVATLPVKAPPMPAAAQRPLWQRPLWLAGLATAALLIVAVVSGWSLMKPAKPTPATVYVTRTGEMLTVPFGDGSVAHLNTRTRLQWTGDARERRVVLLEGEAMFEIANNPARPFRVVLDDSEIQVLGTKFNIYRKPNAEVVVSVIEGAVKVREGHSDKGPSAATPIWEREVRANEQLTYGATGLLTDAHPAATLDAVKWREGVLEVKDDLLPEIVRELERYTDRHIVIRDPRLAQMRLGGTLSTRELRATLDRIGRLVPVAVEENDKGFVLSYRASEVAVAQEEKR